MAVERFMVCDGCDRRELMKEAGLDIPIPVVVIPDNFVACKVTAGSWGKDVQLCRNCYDRLLETADPAKWVRVATSKAE